MVLDAVKEFQKLLEFTNHNIIKAHKTKQNKIRQKTRSFRAENGERSIVYYRVTDYIMI